MRDGSQHRPQRTAVVVAQEIAPSAMLGEPVLSFHGLGERGELVALLDTTTVDVLHGVAVNPRAGEGATVPAVAVLGVLGMMGDHPADGASEGPGEGRLPGRRHAP